MIYTDWFRRSSSE